MPQKGKTSPYVLIWPWWLGKHTPGVVPVNIWFNELISQTSTCGKQTEPGTGAGCWVRCPRWWLSRSRASWSKASCKEALGKCLLSGFLHQSFLILKTESESHSAVSDSLWPHELHSPWNSLGKNTGVGSRSLLQGIFATQGSNPGLPCCRQILYQLNHKGGPLILKLQPICFWQIHGWCADFPKHDTNHNGEKHDRCD